jgi:hypothetical protein
MRVYCSTGRGDDSTPFWDFISISNLQCPGFPGYCCGTTVFLLPGHRKSRTASNHLCLARTLILGNCMYPHTRNGGESASKQGTQKKVEFLLGSGFEKSRHTKVLISWQG